MPQNIVLIGAGRSTASLIRYLIQFSDEMDWHITIAERHPEFAQEKAGNHPRVTITSVDINDDMERLSLIHSADIVISMVPARMHLTIIRDCIAMKKHVVTASYATSEIEDLHQKALDAGVTVMMEMGVDPGIDHMSAMKLLDQIRTEDGKMLLFESFTGGLIAPESDNNPWNYKFTWNPRNVVLAGQGGAAKFIQEGKYKYIPYHQLFRRTEFIEIEGHGSFEGYANRDSLSYRSVYGLDDIPTIYRGTLRRPGFSRAWDVFVKLGATDDSYIMEGSNNMTHREFINSFLAYNTHDSVELKLMHYLNIPQDSVVLDKLKWLGIFDDTPIGLEDATPAKILQHILEKKWKLEEGDRDMIVMWHKFGWEDAKGEKKMMTSHMVVKGEDQTYTSMAQTVGLPVGIAVRLISNGTITSKGVCRPVSPEIYNPVLQELETYGIRFEEKAMVPQFYWKEKK